MSIFDIPPRKPTKPVKGSRHLRDIAIEYGMTQTEVLYLGVKPVRFGPDGLFDAWFMPEDIEKHVTTPARAALVDAGRGATWKDEAFRRARALLAGDREAYSYQGAPNTSTLADVLTANPPIDGEKRLPIRRETLRKELSKHRDKLV